MTNDHLKQPIVISCSPYVLPYLKKEVIEAGFEIDSDGESFTTIQVTGTFEDTIRLNLILRTANHVYLLIDRFIASDLDELYASLKKISWEEWIPDDGYFSVHAISDHPQVDNTMFLNVKVKDAIADHFQEALGKRPDSGSEKNKVVIFLFWKDNEASVFLDTSGEPLIKHGYRKISLRAPLQESLGAAMIMATRWDTKSSFVNPMCGSGTLAIEAALMACNKSPGLIRDNFGFMHVKGYDESIYLKMKEELTALVKKDIPFKIIASDRERDALNAAKTNAENAGVSHLIEFIQSDFSSTPVPEEAGVVMFNPPYGERLGSSQQLEKTYEDIGSFLKKSCRGYWGYVFTANLELAKEIGLKAKRKIDFYNGKLKCKLLEYELYEGSKKKKSEDAA